MAQGLILLLTLLLLGQAGAQDGSTIYARRCIACHLGSGQGVPGITPPLAGHVPKILARPGGREYLIAVVLFGLEGPIRVGGELYSGRMPGREKDHTDAEIAQVLNFISQAWGNRPPPGFQPFTEEEVARVHARRLTPKGVLALRQRVLGP